ncbi:hypothetical protein ONE63_011429 [Megalurothrips usitatus]|uniref:Uncharacterized protein n=1 Tax=Megalurothrips usitatus TaxID=439358 RepID=A0AAV7X1X1_9NEOP|nr:hypothetical protein ONE63_011429 [Megalurothrips usitatus]
MASTEIISIDYGCDKISLCSDDDPVSFRITADLFTDSAIIANDSSSDPLPSGVIHNLKGLLGQKYSAVKDSLELPRCAEGTPTDSTILGAHLQKTPEGVLADLLQGSLKRVAKQSFLLQVVMTVPSYYTAEQRMATISALQLAGFRIKSVIHDTSAILAAVNTKYVAGNNESIVLALDLGHNGGSACIARLRSDTAIVLAHSTERIPGGRDFDNKMLCYLKQLVQDTYKSAVQHSCDEKLMEAWRILKCDLSQKLTSTLRLPVDTVNGSIQVDIDISREAFEKECKPLFEKIVSIVMLTIKKSGIDSSDIHRIFLVGGSSNIPCVRSMLSKSLGKNTDDPAVDELVAYGARLIGTGKFQVIRDIRTSSSWDRNAVIEAVLTVTCNAIPSAQQLAQVKTVDGFWWQVASIMKGPTAYKETVRKAALSLYKEVYQRHCKETFVEVIQNAIIDRGLKCSSTVPNETANLQAEGDATGATLGNNRCGVTEVPHNSGAQEPELEPGEDSDGGTSEFMQVPPGLVKRKTFSITRQSWESIINGADKTKLVSYEWGTVINSWIEAEYNQFCVLKCRYHHVSPIDRRKKNVPLLHATAQCKFNNCGCLSFDITIAKPETTTEDLQVTVTSSGNFCHRVGEKHRRHIRQNERSQFKAKLDVMAPSVLTRRAVATKSKETNALTYGHADSGHPGAGAPTSSPGWTGIPAATKVFLRDVLGVTPTRSA